MFCWLNFCCSFLLIFHDKELLACRAVAGGALLRFLPQLITFGSNHIMNIHLHTPRRCLPTGFGVDYDCELGPFSSLKFDFFF
jgi:hypothetical protein